MALNRCATAQPPNRPTLNAREHGRRAPAIATSGTLAAGNDCATAHAHS